jgi:hypothetical protein
MTVRKLLFAFSFFQVQNLMVKNKWNTAGVQGCRCSGGYFGGGDAGYIKWGAFFRILHP